MELPSKKTVKGKRIKVLRLIARLNIGGPAVQVITLTQALSNPLFETLLVAGSLPEGEGDMSYLADEMGISPLYLPCLSREISLLNDIKAFFHIVKLILQFEPDIVHTHTAKAGSLGRAAAGLINLTRPADKRIRIVHTFHGHTFHSYFGKLKTSVFIGVERVLSKVTDRIVAISPLQKRDLCSAYRIAPPNKVSVIPLGFDLSRFGESKPRQGNELKALFPESSSQGFLTGIVGRLTDVKNPRLLLRVAEIIKDLGLETSFSFVVVGDGKLKSALKEEARSLELDGRVTFTGWRTDVEAVYASMDAVLLTSVNEGTPVSLIEAMASGIPVIATDVGGVRDLMGKELYAQDDRFRVMQNGIIVPAGDAGAMALALVHMKKNISTFKERASKTRVNVQKIYSSQRLIDDISALYLSFGIDG